MYDYHHKDDKYGKKSYRLALMKRPFDLMVKVMIHD